MPPQWQDYVYFWECIRTVLDKQYTKYTSNILGKFLQMDIMNFPATPSFAHSTFLFQIFLFTVVAAYISHDSAWSVTLKLYSKLLFNYS